MLVPLIAAVALLAAAPAALAGDTVLVVHGDRIDRRWDPDLPPDPHPLTPDPPPARAAGDARDVRRALNRALAKGGISQRQRDRYDEILTEAHATLRQRHTVGKKCRIQLARVVGVIETMAERGTLDASRMPALFLQLRRNTEFWSQQPNIRLGERVSFEDDPLIFQHYKGYGLQIQPLGNFGKANGLWTECQEEPDQCKPRALEALLDSMLRISSWRAGAKAWEYWFPFGGGYPPWASGMAQATGMQALARAAVFLAEPRFMRAARNALPLFLKPPPVGVRVRADRGYHYLLYSFAPKLRVLNAFLQAITGLHDYAKLNHDKRARKLFRAGDRAARREAPRYDTGKWSYYSLPYKNLSTNDYHLLVIGFLDNLCERTHARVYCRIAKRFKRYAHKRGIYPPKPSPPGGEPPEGPRCGEV